MNGLLSASAGLLARINAANDRYGPFSSTQEALGVCLEEWDELRAAIHANDLDAIAREALDLAAPLIRLHDQIVAGEGKFVRRSVK